MVRVIVIEGSVDDVRSTIEAIRPLVSGASAMSIEGSTISQAEIEADAETVVGGEHYVTVEFACTAVSRRPLAPAPRAVLKALYDAGVAYVTTTDLVRAAGYRSGHQFAGLMGAFGRRLANTKGYDGEATFFESRWNEAAEAWEYRLPENVRKALEQERLV